MKKLQIPRLEHTCQRLHNRNNIRYFHSTNISVGWVGGWGGGGDGGKKRGWKRLPSHFVVAVSAVLSSIIEFICNLHVLENLLLKELLIW